MNNSVNEEKTISEVRPLLVGRYAVPLVGDDDRINLYLYNEDRMDEVMSYFNDKSEKEESNIKLTKEILDTDKLYLDFAEEFAIPLNEDYLEGNELTEALLECLYHASKVIMKLMESEEFGARVITAAFKELVKYLEKEPLKDITKGHDMEIGEYRFPLVNDDYTITLYVYDNNTLENFYRFLRPSYGKDIDNGKLDLSICNGLVVTPTIDGPSVLLNIEGRDSEKIRLELVHELFHAAIMAGKVFESTEVEARLYKSMFHHFFELLYHNLDESANQCLHQSIECQD